MIKKLWSKFKTWPIWAKLLFGFCVVPVCISMLVQLVNPEYYAQKQQERKEAEAYKKAVADQADLPLMAYQIAKDYVRLNLKSPSTADFPWSATSTQKTATNQFIVKGYVDSKNAFNATIRSYWECLIYYKGSGEITAPSSWGLVTINIQ